MFLKRVNEVSKSKQEFEDKLSELALRRLNDKEDAILTIDEFECKNSKLQKRHLQIKSETKAKNKTKSVRSCLKIKTYQTFRFSR